MPDQASDANSAAAIKIEPVSDKSAKSRFIDYGYKRNAHDPHWVPPLRDEVTALLTPGKNPFFEHAKLQLFLATRRGEVVGRISAHYDELAQTRDPSGGLGPGTGNWGMLEADDEAVAAALIARAEEWLKDQGMTRVLAPMNLSLWDEPGLLIKGFEYDPTVMMGHNLREYQGWVEAQGYVPAKRLYTYLIDIVKSLPPVIQRLINAGKRNPSITLRQVDKSRFDDEAAVILGILNDAWDDNWGHVPITDSEIAHVGKKLKPLVREDLISIAEVDGEPAAFMMTLPNLNQELKSLGGSLFPFGWAKLLCWLRNPKCDLVRVPLMGVLKKYQSSLLAGQLAFMLIDDIRHRAVGRYGAKMAEFGWILEDNTGMIAIADSVGSQINREYMIYQKLL